MSQIKEPKCKTCGGTGRYHNCDTWGCSSVDHINKAEPCPDCTEQPPASDFTKRFRDLIELSIEHLSDNKIGRLQTYSKEACDRLDRSEASRKELLTACGRGLNRLLELGQRESMDTLKILKAAIKQGD